jgi:hypothetical protein
MRKEYDFSSGVRGRFSTRGPRQHRAGSVARTFPDSCPVDQELTPAQVRELLRRMADVDHATRYILVSQMGPRFALYYNVSEDVYVMNDPNGATLFKRRNAAVAIKKLLSGSIRVLRCKSKLDSGIRVPCAEYHPRTAESASPPSDRSRTEPERRPRLRRRVRPRPARQDAVPVGNTWVTDMRDYLDGAGAIVDMPGPALRSIVAWVTSGRSPDSSIISWHCPLCGDNGVIRGWERTPWDRRAMTATP